MKNDGEPYKEKGQCCEVEVCGVKNCGEVLA